MQPGDKVLCLKADREVEQGKIYTIDLVETYGNASLNPGNTVLYLVGCEYPYTANRFERVPTGGGAQTGNVAVHISPLKITPTLNTASKNDQAKIDLSLIPRVSNVEHAKAFMVGEKKYGRYNYCKGHKASQLVAAAKRHLDAWFEGEEHDPTDGQHHLGSVMACCSMILRQQELDTLTDDRFVKADLVEGTEV